MEGFTKGLQSFQQVFEMKSELGRMIDGATSEQLLSPDGVLNAKVRDAVNANAREGAGDAVRCLRKRLKHKNPKVQLLSLTLTDYLVRHCGREIHEQVASKDFMTDLQSLVSGLQNMETDMQVNRKVLTLIQCWGESFQTHQDEFPMYYETYASLKSQGIRFPDYDPSTSFVPNLRATRPASAATAYSANNAPVVEPGGGADWNLRRVKPPASQAAPVCVGSGLRGTDCAMLLGTGAEHHGGPAAWNPAAMPPPAHAYAPTTQPAPAPKFNHARLRTDLDEVEMQAGLLTDALSAPESSRDRTLVSQLGRNCRIFQDRLLVLMQQASEEPGVVESILTASEAVGAALTLLESNPSAAAPRHRPAAPDRSAAGRQGALVDFSAPSGGARKASEEEDDVWKLMGGEPDPGPTSGGGGAGEAAAAEGDDWGADWTSELAALGGSSDKPAPAASAAAPAATSAKPSTHTRQEHTEEEDELALLGFGESLPPPRPAGAPAAAPAAEAKAPTQLLD